MMASLNITIQIWKKDKYFLAYCPELDFISQGNTFENARKNLIEVIEIQFEEMAEMGTLHEYLKECGFEIGDQIKADREFIGFEKTSLKVAL